MMIGPALLVLLGTTFTFGRAKLVCEKMVYDYNAQWSDNCYDWGLVYDYTLASAEQLCNEVEASLTSIHSQEENAFLAALDIDEAIIGLHNVSGGLQWLDGSPVDFLNFAQGELYTGPVDCVKIKNGKWYKMSCSPGAQLGTILCKKKVIDVPDTPAYECPSEAAVYTDYGMLYSPGYPEDSQLPTGKICYYHLEVKEGYKVVLDTPVKYSWDGVVQVYEGWTVDPSKLLKEIRTTADTAISTVDSNQMLILYWLEQCLKCGDRWKFEFYGERAHPSTGNPALPTTTPVSTPNCPKQNTFQVDSIITSPGFPFVYERNTDCTYYAIHPSYTCAAFQIEVVELNIGNDDLVEFFDTNTGEVFASTTTNLVEGSQFASDFTIGIHFRSGNVAETFGNWRFVVEGMCGTWSPNGTMIPILDDRSSKFSP